MRTPAIHYILKDHLGSWTTITDATGNIEQELSFDAWGNLRDPDAWTGAPTETPLFDRGYTGHEHLYDFGLINMNGRMYDPLMSSFLSVDRYVQSPENSQNFNRYAYCLNNPLKYTDPSGWVMQGALMGNPSQGVVDYTSVFMEPIYTPRDLGLLQLPDYDELAWWREGNEIGSGGGGGGPTVQVVTDAGHGIKGSSNPCVDPGACDGNNKESDFALLIERSLSEWLTKYGISIERTRNSEMIINENAINYRWKLANKTGAEVFVSIHLNSGLSEEAFAVYEERGNSLKWQQENSMELGNYIMENMTVMAPANNPVVSSTKTRLKTIGVLRYFKGSAGVLLEMGGISSEANRNNIINNHSIIGREIATGVYQYLNNGAKPPTAIYKCVYY